MNGPLFFAAAKSPPVAKLKAKDKIVISLFMRPSSGNLRQMQAFSSTAFSSQLGTYVIPQNVDTIPFPVQALFQFAWQNVCKMCAEPDLQHSYQKIFCVPLRFFLNKKQIQLSERRFLKYTLTAMNGPLLLSANLLVPTPARECLMEKGETAHGSRLTAHGSRLTARRLAGWLGILFSRFIHNRFRRGSDG